MEKKRKTEKNESSMQTRISRSQSPEENLEVATKLYAGGLRLIELDPSGYRKSVYERNLLVLEALIVAGLYYQVMSPGVSQEHIRNYVFAVSGRKPKNEYITDAVSFWSNIEGSDYIAVVRAKGGTGRHHRYRISTYLGVHETPELSFDLAQRVEIFGRIVGGEVIDPMGASKSVRPEKPNGIIDSPEFPDRESDTASSKFRSEDRAENREAKVSNHPLRAEYEAAIRGGMRCPWEDWLRIQEDSWH